ncbi:hypothetical protein Taro_014971 [Colocasia esculenta]|uniref:Uncharacterized protein n=1 Tax=Colocasia esculenta TaxID=4460 RepID=A0A843UG40_COLES|nr:hypothetical protein [Colocasia esculenta]
MASSFVAAGNENHRHHFFHRQQVSPKNSSKKTGFANPPPPATPSCGDGHHHPGGAMPKCVCAPATHAGSFKCRLHRVNSHGHSATSAPAPFLVHQDRPMSPDRIHNKALEMKGKKGLCLGITWMGLRLHKAWCLSALHLDKLAQILSIHLY